MSRESAAGALLNAVVDNDLAALQELLGQGDLSAWRELIRYEFSLPELISDYGPRRLREDPRGPKLLDYEIRTMSALHCAALLGHVELVVELLDRDIPVDTPLSSGSTMLHLASFSGTVPLVNALIDIYKADRFKTDRYGWTALHYASTEGQLETVSALVDAGLEVEARDQDGTTAAFRADVNSHSAVVRFLCEFGSADELLNVVDTYPEQDKNNDVYSKVIKPSTSDIERRVSASGVDLSTFSEDGRVPNLIKNGAPVLPPRNRSLSVPVNTREGSVPVITREGSSTKKTKSKQAKSLPSRNSKNLGKNTVRRLLRKELEQAMCGDYMEPSLCLGYHNKESIPRDEDEDEMRIGGGDGIGLGTLKGIMREELDRYRREALLEAAMEHQAAMGSENLQDPMDDTYASLATLPPAPAVPDRGTSPGSPPGSAPPLPPRNTRTIPRDTLDIDETTEALGTIRLRKFDSSETVIRECFARLSVELGKQWKRLAKALPLSSDNAMLEKRIAAIEKCHPDAVDKQALASLVEWRINSGKQASLDDLIVALRKAALQDLVPVVDKISQDFTA